MSILMLKKQKKNKQKIKQNTTGRVLLLMVPKAHSALNNSFQWSFRALSVRAEATRVGTMRDAFSMILLTWTHSVLETGYLCFDKNVHFPYRPFLWDYLQTFQHVVISMPEYITALAYTTPLLRRASPDLNSKAAIFHWCAKEFLKRAIPD